MENVIGAYIGGEVNGIKKTQKVGQDKNNGRTKLESLPMVGSKLMERKLRRDARARHVRIEKKEEK